jgi:hypothetical protein
VEEDDTNSSPPDEDAPADAGVPSSSAPSLEGKIRDPISSDDEDDDEEDKEEEVEATKEVATSTPAKRKREAVAKSPAKKAKASALVQSKITAMVNSTAPKAKKKSPSVADTEGLIDLSESSDESSDKLPRLKG